MQLKTPLTYTIRVQPITLPLPGFETTGPSVAAGWGQSGGNMFPVHPNRLQYINFTIPTQEGRSPNVLRKNEHILCLFTVRIFFLV